MFPSGPIGRNVELRHVVKRFGDKRKKQICFRTQKVCELEENAHRWVFLGNSGTGNPKEPICLAFVSCRVTRVCPAGRNVEITACPGMKEKIIFAPNEFSTGRECSPLNLLGQFWNRKFESCLAVPGRSDPPVELFHCDMSSNLEMKEKHRFRA